MDDGISVPGVVWFLVGLLAGYGVTIRLSGKSVNWNFFGKSVNWNYSAHLTGAMKIAPFLWVLNE